MALIFGAYTTVMNASELRTKSNVTVIENYTEVNPFCKLIRDGNYDAVKAMIKSGENVNRESTGLTPLMFAARYNRSKIAQLLIDNGARLKTKTKRGYTALKWAKLSKAEETLTVLKKAMKK